MTSIKLNYVVVCTVKPYEILRVKNALIKSCVLCHRVWKLWAFVVCFAQLNCDDLLHQPATNLLTFPSVT